LPKITKDMVLQGYNSQVQIAAAEYGEDAVFIVASPSASDISEAKALRMRLSEVKGEVDPSHIDLSKALIAEEKARRFLTAKALSRGMEEEWTIDDLDKIKPAILNRLWREVDIFTGFSGEAEEEAKNFQKVQKGKS